jgi:P-type E1-E2 ATPase
VRSILPARGWTEAELLRLAAGVEAYSAHPLATAVVDEAGSRGIPVPAARNVQETPAFGVTAVVDGHHVAVGKRTFVARGSEDEPRGMAVFEGVDGRYAGAVLLGDPPRPEAAGVVAALRRLGVRRILLLTGDREHAAQEVGAAVGVADLQHSCLPEDKVRAIRSEPLRPVAMVGDGVNDAPVLAVADVGIAMGARGSGAATESADVVVLVEDLRRVVTSVEIGRRTTTVARRAVLLGIALSVLLMLVATTGVLPAIVGAGCQELVDLASILYALRARFGPADAGADERIPAPREARTAVGAGDRR